MINLNEIAGIFSLGCDIGYFNVEDIINWADTIIAKGEKTDNILLDLTLCKNKHPLDVAGLLRNLCGEKITQNSYHIVYGLIARDYINEKLDDISVAKMLDKLGDIPEEGHWPDLLCNISDDDEIKIVKEKLLSYLDRFKEYAKEWDYYFEDLHSAGSK